jgi:hypothetical protein
MQLRSALFGALLACALVVPAKAANVTWTYNFSLSEFMGGFAPGPSPIGPISGSFTLTFDPTITPQLNQTVGLTTNSLVGVTTDNPLAFSVFEFNSAYFISIGGLPSSGTINGFTNDFTLSLKFADAASLGSPSLTLCGEPGFICGPLSQPSWFASGATVSSNGDIFLATVGTVEAIAAVPETSTWAMMFLGFAGVGLLTYRRSRKDGVLALAAT